VYVPVESITVDHDAVIAVSSNLHSYAEQFTEDLATLVAMNDLLSGAWTTDGACYTQVMADDAVTSLTRLRDLLEAESALLAQGDKSFREVDEASASTLGSL
jgi:uncharacterized protein YukE